MVHISRGLVPVGAISAHGCCLATAKVWQAQVAERYQVATAELLLKRRRIWSDNKRFLSKTKISVFLPVFVRQSC